MLGTQETPDTRAESCQETVDSQALGGSGRERGLAWATGPTGETQEVMKAPKEEARPSFPGRFTG